MQTTSGGAASAATSSGGITIPATPTSAGTSGNIYNDDLWHASPSAKRIKLDIASTSASAMAANNSALDDDSIDVAASETSSTSQVAGTSASDTYVPGATSVLANEDSENEALIVDCESPRPQQGGGGGESPSKYWNFDWKLNFFKCLIKLGYIKYILLVS